jgi:hypothetical protein
MLQSDVHHVSSCTRGFSILERIQVPIFCVQESIISALYIYETKSTLLTIQEFRQNTVRKILHHLIWINLLIILLDIAVVTLELAGFYDFQTTLKTAGYGFKLRLEFIILNQLLGVIQTSRATNPGITEMLERNLGRPPPPSGSLTLRDTPPFVAAVHGRSSTADEGHITPATLQTTTEVSRTKTELASVADESRSAFMAVDRVGILPDPSPDAIAPVSTAERQHSQPPTPSTGLEQMGTDS